MAKWLSVTLSTKHYQFILRAWHASNCSRWASSSLRFPCSFSSSWWRSRTGTKHKKNNPDVEVNSIILDISRSVLIQKSTTHQFFEETHHVLIDRVIIRTCFDAFSCAFQKRTEAKDHTLTSKTTQKKYAKQHDFFTTSRFWDFFLSWRPKKKNRRRQHLDDDFGDPNPASSKASVERWSWAFFFEPIRKCYKSSPPNLRHIGCTFHVKISSRFEQNTWLEMQSIPQNDAKNERT